MGEEFSYGKYNYKINLLQFDLIKNNISINSYVENNQTIQIKYITMISFKYYSKLFYRSGINLQIF